MKIIMDFRKYDGVIGGVERGVLEITNYLAANGHTVIVLPKESRLVEVKQRFSDNPNIQYLPIQVRSHVMSFRNAYIDSTVIPDLAARVGADIIHFPYNWSFPFRKSVPTVLTIHDVIPLTFREAQGFFTNRFLYRPGMRFATRLNDAIATVSAFSKRDISEKLGPPLEKITVIPNGLRDIHAPDEALRLDLNRRFQLVDGYILYVGGIHERKNVDNLIRAFRQLVDRTGYPGKLLVTGSVSGPPYQEKMKKVMDATVDETGLHDRVVFTGFVSDQELDNLMRDTEFLVYPSFYEGFGIPVLEAMRLKTPVITSRVTALPEVAGGAALLVDPSSVDDIMKGMANLLKDQDLREELRGKGVARAKDFSWGRTSEMYLDLYRSLSR